MARPQRQPATLPRRVNRAATLVALVLFTWYAWARITTPPAAGWYARPPEATEDTAGPALRGVLDVLVENLPAIPTQSRSGLGFSSFADPNNVGVTALAWRFRTARPIPAEIDEYLAANTERIDASAVALDSVTPLPIPQSPRISLLRRDRIGVLMIAAEMERAAGQGDHARAMRLAATVRILVEQTDDLRERRYPIANSIRKSIGIVLQRYAIPAEATDPLIAALARDDGLRIASHLQAAAGLNIDLEALLDCHYTRDADGNGWLVVSTLPRSTIDPGLFGQMPTFPVRNPPRPTRVWNLLSGVFYTRAAVRDRFERMRAAIDRLDSDPLPRGIDPATWRDLNVSPRSGPLATRVDIPPAWLIYEFTPHIHRRRMIVIMARLSAYRAAHGTYPPQLDDLPGPLPVRADTRRPFEYRRLAADRYELHGGKLRNPRLPEHDR